MTDITAELDGKKPGRSCSLILWFNLSGNLDLESEPSKVIFKVGAIS